jgi:hypothetical protein
VADNSLIVGIISALGGGALTGAAARLLTARAERESLALRTVCEQNVKLVDGLVENNKAMVVLAGSVDGLNRDEGYRFQAIQERFESQEGLLSDVKGSIDTMIAILAGRASETEGEK